MSATIISFASRSSIAPGGPQEDWTPDIRGRLAAVESHRSRMARRREINARHRSDLGDPPDPIFAKIDAHCAALVSYHEAIGDDDASDLAMDRESEVLRGLMSCRPNSLDGILALLNHLGQPEFLIYGREGTDMTILEQVMEIAKKEGQAFPLTLEATIRAVIIAICASDVGVGNRP
jgi:hypothetical protein